MRNHVTLSNLPPGVTDRDIEDAQEPGPIAVLRFDTTPPTGNKIRRMHWAQERALKKTWLARITAEILHRRKYSINDQAHYIGPGTKRRFVLRWSAPQPPDEANARFSFDKLIGDRLKKFSMKKVPGGGMIRVENTFPLTWDDDPDHLEVEYVPTRGKRGLVVEVYEATP